MSDIWEEEEDRAYRAECSPEWLAKIDERARQRPTRCDGHGCTVVLPAAQIQEGLCPACMITSEVETHQHEAGELLVKARDPQRGPSAGDATRVKALAALVWQAGRALEQLGRRDMARESDDVMEWIATRVLPAVAWELGRVVAAEAADRRRRERQEERT